MNMELIGQNADRSEVFPATMRSSGQMTSVLGGTKDLQPAQPLHLVRYLQVSPTMSKAKRSFNAPTCNQIRTTSHRFIVTMVDGR